MNDIINKFLLPEEKFMPEMYSRLPRFTNSAWGQFTKNKGRTQNLKETGDTKYIYQNEWNKPCFQCDMAYTRLIFWEEQQLLIKYYMIKHLMLLRIQNVTDIKADLLHCY